MIANVDIQTAARATTGEWIWCAALLVIPFGVTAAVFVLGAPGRKRGLAALIDRPAAGVELVTGRPAWSSAGVQVGIWALITAATGFFWDVAWHIDLGRDKELFTPPHTMIVAGLVGLAGAGIVSAVLATAQGAAVGLRIGRVRIPWGALGLLVLGVFASIGFPLDDMWHASYGVDVTMWSPTHLMMISGAAFAPLAVWLLYLEGGVTSGRRGLHRTARLMLVGALVVALAAFQLEFDDGVPQWQMLFQPVLIGLTGTAALTIARVALGRGWALIGAASFLAVRAILTVIVGGLLHHVVSHFPIYLGLAACIEAGFLLTSRRPLLTQAVVVGALAGTVGLATEWAWTHIWGFQEWGTSLLPGIWAAVLAAVAGAVLGCAGGTVLGGGRPRIPALALVGAAVAGLVSLAVPFPRHGAAISATVNATPAGPSQPTIDRYGRVSFLQDVNVDIAVSPASAAEGADVFRVIDWQGGGRIGAPFQEVAPGHWRTTEPVTTGGSWKTIVYLQKQDVIVAAPVAMPSDPDYGQAAIPLAHNRTTGMTEASNLLMRESHSGSRLPQVLAYGGYSLELLTWFGVLALSYTMVARSGGDHPSAPRAPATRRGLAPVTAAR